MNTLKTYYNQYNTLAKIARMFGINQRKVKTLAKWYAREKGKNLKDYMVSLGPKHHVYNLPNDFINYVKEQLSNEHKKPGTQHQ